MLTISKALSAKQAKNYYKNEYSKTEELSISPSAEEVQLTNSALENEGIWHGKLAAEMDLQGAVETEHFERLCDGLHPLTEEQLVCHAPVKKYTNRFGKEITTMGHRAGWDLTFSAPKTVSLAATIGGDERIKESHRQSVKTALDELEKYTGARIGGNNPAERTGKMVSALFEHYAARPDKIFGYAAPQLHTHSVTFNLTKTENGIFKPLQPLEIYRSQKYATAVYRIELADKLQKLGYEIEIDQKTKAPEIKGFNKEYVRENSLRGAEIKKEAKAVKKNFELTGANISNDAGIRQVAAWQGRANKNFDPEEMKSRALELEVKYDFQAQRIYQQALSRNSYQYNQFDINRNAVRAVDSAKDSAIEQSLNTEAKLFNHRQFLTRALESGLSQTNFNAVKENFNLRHSTGEFSQIISQSGKKIQMDKIAAETVLQQTQHSYENSSNQPELQKVFKDLKTADKNEIKTDNSIKPETNDFSDNKSKSESPENVTKHQSEKKLSMDEIEQSIRRGIAAQQEISKGAELLLAL